MIDGWTNGWMDGRIEKLFNETYFSELLFTTWTFPYRILVIIYDNGV